MEETKTFSLRTVLTVTTGRLLTEPKGDRDNGIGDLYEILAWMTMDSPFTHQLGRFAEECRPHLYRLFPDLALADACLSKLDDWLASAPSCPQEGIKMWLTELEMLFPGRLQAEYQVPQFPISHVEKDPIEELQVMAPHAEIIAIAAPAEPDGAARRARMNVEHAAAVVKHNAAADTLWFGDLHAIGYDETVRLSYPYRALVNRVHKSAFILDIRPNAQRTFERGIQGRVWIDHTGAWSAEYAATTANPHDKATYLPINEVLPLLGHQEARCEY